MFDSVTVLTDDPKIGHTRWSKDDREPQPIADARDLAVTIPRIREELEALLPDGELTEWLVLHFAGHGVRLESTRTLWLPSDWSTEARAISVELLKTSLEFYGIENMTIIGDACRDFIDHNTASLTADGVMPKGPARSARPSLERVNAAQDGKSAYMVPGAKPKDARCILSSVLADAIWGHEPGAFASHDPDKVVSGSLFRHVIRTTREVGERYGLSAEADIDLNLGSGGPERVYYDRGTPPHPLVPPIVWPALERETASPPQTWTKVSKSTSDGFPPPGPARRGQDEEVTVDDTDADGGSDMAVVGGNEYDFLGDEETQHALIELLSAGPLTASPRKASRRSRIRSALHEGQRRPPPEGDIVVRGGTPVRIWARSPTSRVGRYKAWQIEREALPGEQVVIEFKDGLFAPIVVYPELTTYCIRRKDKIAGWYGVPNQDDSPPMLAQTFDAISRLQTSDLSASAADELALTVRYSKHRNPVLGAIAAYLYDYLGDRENIWRMAWYYSCAGQPIPFDIMQLGLLEVMEAAAGLIAFVPGAPQVESRASRPEFTTEKTPASSGIVGGRCPWLRQGWDALGVPDIDLGPDTELLRSLIPHLLDSSFTALNAKGGHMMIEALGLRRDR